MSRTLTIILDVDDVLMPCVAPAADIVRKETGVNISYETTTEWGFTNFPAEIGNRMREVMISSEFHRNQKPFPGAVEMVQQLLNWNHKVLIFSAVPPAAMGERVNTLQKYFPICPDNIILGGNKNLMKGDILLDDGLHNIIGSQCMYPILFRRPWNEKEKKVLSVENYAAFLKIVERIASLPYTDRPIASMQKQPKFIALIGPPASGKSSIMKELLKDPRFVMARAITSRHKREGEQDEEYRFVSRMEFEKMHAEGMLLERTEYLGNLYGMSVEELQPIWDIGKIPIRPMDINGALAVKNVFQDKAITIFIRRNKNAVLASLLQRNTHVSDTVRRIVSLDQEYQNESLCDWTISNNGTVEDAVRQIFQILN